jgi:hypothetical protein
MDRTTGTGSTAMSNPHCCSKLLSVVFANTCTDAKDFKARMWGNTKATTLMGWLATKIRLGFIGPKSFELTHSSSSLHWHRKFPT